MIKFNGKVIQNDPRKFLKALEREQMIETWKKKAPKQFLWFSCHPKQILLQSRKIWEDSIKSGDGGMWLYFIFAVCQWLPTNHRVFYGNKSERHPEYCQLCLQSGTEDLLWELLGNFFVLHSRANSVNGNCLLWTANWTLRRNVAGKVCWERENTEE